MNCFQAVGASIVILAAYLSLAGAEANEQGQAQDSASGSRIAPATTPSEARSRARIVHELMHGTLQVVHRDFFDDEDAHAIPSASLEDVFREMSENFDVKMKWLIVNTDVVNVDHQPHTAFEKAAVRTLAAGEPFAERLEGNRYYFAGAIRLGSQCLKCHLKGRTDNDDRTAGLVISMPMIPPSEAEPTDVPNGRN